MAMHLQEVVPFGRSLDEYIQMFNLTEADWAGAIVGVADGPASFNAEATAGGRSVISVDPIYQFSGEAIWQRFNAVVDTIIDQVTATPLDWVWSYHDSPAALRASRVATIQRFLSDYDLGKRAGRYQVASLPTLPFRDRQFSLALCSHFLFLYSAHCDRAFHLAAVQELLRVSAEVRIFPLVSLDLTRSPHLDAIIQTVIDQGYQAEIVPVRYEFQKGGNQMLRIRSGQL